MNEKGYGVDTVTCNIVIDGLCKSGKLDKAMEIAQEMWTHGSAALEKIYEAKKKFREMMGKNLQPDAVIFDTFIHIFCKEGKISSSFRVLKDMEKKGCNKSIQTYNSLILGLGSKNQIFEIYGLVDEMRERGITPNVCIYNNIIQSLCKNGKTQDTTSILDDMLQMVINPNISTFRMLIEAFYKASDFGVAKELFEIGLSTCGHKEAFYSLMFNELLSGGLLLEPK
ncbi:hypothetical protein Gotur_013833, partial [Gossypium turneri]